MKVVIKFLGNEAYNLIEKVQDGEDRNNSETFLEPSAGRVERRAWGII
jgi:hypothetical protein